MRTLMYISHGVICRKFIPILKHILCDYDHADRNGQREFCDNFERVKNLKKNSAVLAAQEIFL